MTKSARKSTLKEFEFRRGGDPRQGRGPKKGAPNAGRPPKAYVDWCRGVIRDPKVEKAVLAILGNPRHKHFAAIYKEIATRAHGKPVQPLVGHDGGALFPPAVAVRLVKPDGSD